MSVNINKYGYKILDKIHMHTIISLSGKIIQYYNNQGIPIMYNPQNLALYSLVDFSQIHRRCPTLNALTA